MNRITEILLIGLLLIVPTACSDDADEPTPEPIPEALQEYATYPFSRLEMSEEITSDAQPVTSTQTYLYSDGLLHTRIGKQEISVGGELLWETADTTTVAYRGGQAVITEDTGTTLTYTLNLQGYATECIRQEAAGSVRSYTFIYNIDSEERHQLASITEYIDGAPFSSLAIDYADPLNLRVTQQVESLVQRFTLSIDPDDLTENRSDIPCLFLADIYPLSLHNAALYGKLIGEHTAYLISQITPDSDGSSTETTTYTYTTDDLGIVTRCREVISHTEADSYEETYTRRVYYDIQ